MRIGRTRHWVAGLSNQGGPMRRWHILLVACASSGLVGCPAQKGECSEQKNVLVGATDDPLLGTFKGSLSWLQTGENTTVELTTTALDTDVEYPGCGEDAARVEVTISTGDGVLGKTSLERWVVNVHGRISFEFIHVAVDATDIVEAGKLPDAVDILDRNPEAVFVLTLGEMGMYDAALTVTSASDHLTAAMGTLQKTGP